MKVDSKLNSDLPFPYSSYIPQIKRIKMLIFLEIDWGVHVLYSNKAIAALIHFATTEELKHFKMCKIYDSFISS